MEKDKQNILQLLINNPYELSMNLCLSIQWYEGIYLIKKLLGLSKIPYEIFLELLNVCKDEELLKNIYDNSEYLIMPIKEAKDLQLFKIINFLEIPHKPDAFKLNNYCQIKFKIETIEDFLLIENDKIENYLEIYDKDNIVLDALNKRNFYGLFILGYDNFEDVEYLEFIKNLEIKNSKEFINYCKIGYIQPKSEITKIVYPSSLGRKVSYYWKYYFWFDKDSNLYMFYDAGKGIREDVRFKFQTIPNDQLVKYYEEITSEYALKRDFIFLIIFSAESLKRNIMFNLFKKERQNKNYIAVPHRVSVENYCEKNLKLLELYKQRFGYNNIQSVSLKKFKLNNYV